MFNIVIQLSKFTKIGKKPFIIPYYDEKLFSVYDSYGNVYYPKNGYECDDIIKNKKLNWRALKPSVLINNLPEYENLVILGFDISSEDEWFGNTTPIIMSDGFKIQKFTYNNLRNLIINNKIIAFKNSNFKNMNEILFFMYNLTLKNDSKLLGIDGEYNYDKPSYTKFKIKCKHGNIKTTTYNSYNNNGSICAKECYSDVSIFNLGDKSQKIKQSKIDEDITSVAQLKKFIILDYKENTGIHEKVYLCECDTCGDQKLRSRGNLLHSISFCQKCSSLGSMKTESDAFDEATNAMEIKFLTLKENVSYIGVKFTYYPCICDLCGYDKILLSHDKLINSYNGCKNCITKESKNLIDIDKIIVFDSTEKMFDNCIYKRRLRFDRYNKKYNILLEYDGKQHFSEIEYFGGIEGFNKRKICDKIKTEYAINNGFNFIRIAYYEDHVKVLKDFLKLLEDNTNKQVVQIYGKVQIIVKEDKAE